MERQTKPGIFSANKFAKNWWNFQENKKSIYAILQFYK